MKTKKIWKPGYIDFNSYTPLAINKEHLTLSISQYSKADYITFITFTKEKFKEYFSYNPRKPYYGCDTPINQMVFVNIKLVINNLCDKQEHIFYLREDYEKFCRSQYLRDVTY